MEGDSKETSAVNIESPKELEHQPLNRSNVTNYKVVDTNPDEGVSRPSASVVHKYKPSNLNATPSPTSNASSNDVMDYPVGGLPPDDNSEEHDSSYRSSYHHDKSSKENLLDLERSLVESATSNTQTLMHLIKGNLGTGVLALPLAFKHAGLWTGLAGVLIIGSIALHCMHILVKCGHILCRRTGIQTMDYSDVAEYCLKTGSNRFAKYSGALRKFVNVLLIFTQFGFCCVYVVFISQSIEQVIHHFHPNDPHLIVYEIITAAVLIPFVFVRKLQHLAPFSAFANVLTLTGLIIIFQYVFERLPDTSKRPTFSEIQDLPLFFGTAFFALEGISLVLPLENAMKRPQDFACWDGVLNLGMVIVIVLYTSMGFYGYLKFGDEIEASITLNLPQDNWLYLSVKLMFAVAIFISYGIQVYVPIKILWPMLRKKISNPFFHRYGEYVCRMIFVLVTFGFAAIIPHLDLLISLIGAFASSSLAIILPVSIEIATLLEEGHPLPWWFWLKNGIIFVFGILGCITGTYSALREIILTF